MIAHWAFRLLLGILRALPPAASHALATACVKLFDLAVPRLRRTAYRNLEIAMPEADSTLITDRVFASIARMLFMFARFPKLNHSNIQNYIRYEGFEHFVEAKRRGKGVLFATAHMGAWELSAFAHALMAEPMYVVVRPLDNARVDSLVSQYRTGSGNSLISKKDAARSILRALHDNEAVGVLIDQNVSQSEGVFVDFFGTPACAGSAFARIAHRTGAAVIPGFALWSNAEGRFILRFYPILETSGDVERDTQTLHSHLEKIIREYPDQWLWIHRRWKTRPPGDPVIY